MASYVPFLHGKSAEYQALNDLEGPVQSQIMPLITLTKVPWDYDNDAPSTTVESHVGKTLQDLWQAWPMDPLYLDPTAIAFTEPRDTDAISFTFERAEEFSLVVVPVLRLRFVEELGYTYAHLDFEHGACIRIATEEIGPTAESLSMHLKYAAGVLGLSPEEIDVALDLADMRSQGAGPAALIASHTLGPLASGGWRSMIVGMSAFPPNLSDLDADSLSEIPRFDWQAYRHVVEEGNLPRTVVYGDYGIDNPELTTIDPRVMQMSGNIRYALEDQWLIARGHNVNQPDGYSQSRQLCARIVEHSGFCGEDYSWGDGWIARRARGEETSGSATTWRRVGFGHHMTLTVNQIASLTGA